MKIKLEFDRGEIVKDARGLPECIILEAETVVAGGIISVISATVAVIGYFVGNDYALLLGYSGLVFSIGVMTAFDLGRKLGNRLIRR